MSNWAVISAGPTDLDEVRHLFRDYAQELGIDLGFQGFEEELAALPGRYAPPDGELLVVRGLGGAVACAALRRHDASSAEIKRVYVRPEARGSGLARELSERLIQIAVERGYSRVLLDTLGRLKPAVHLYESLGFSRCDPYNHNPEPDVLYFERIVASGQARSEKF